MNFNTRKQVPLLLSVAVAVAISGCAEKRRCDTVVPVQKAVSHTQDLKDLQIKQLQVAIAEARAQQGKTIIKEVTVPGESSLYPPNATPGHCYARVLIPEKYRVETEKVLVKEPGEKLIAVPAKYRWVAKKVLIKEAAEKIVTVPPKYKTVTEKILVSEPGEKIISIPPVYETVTEKIMVKPAHTEWKRGRGTMEKLDGKTGEILCLVKVPPVYKTITKKVLKRPAQTKVVPIPARYKTVTKRVVAVPAQTKTVMIPAKYKIIKVKELVEPASVKKIPVPPVYKTVTKKIKVADPILKWVPVVCKSNMTGNLVQNVQEALQERGFNPGPIDGIYGPRTRAALHKFQRANHLAVGGMTKETLRALGL
ncbi:MAG: hypothetical protein DSZ05_01815 [Sulfurospirillum sp.]|nr:MAG: hypothetical protein DSZ05_01815 [Sulfurospirillum sp.]